MPRLRQMTMTFTLRVEPALVHVLKEIKARDGIAISQQIREALDMWFVSKGAQRLEEHRRQMNSGTLDSEAACISNQLP
jgi:hypothetical protein